MSCSFALFASSFGLIGPEKAHRRRGQFRKVFTFISLSNSHFAASTSPHHHFSNTSGRCMRSLSNSFHLSPSFAPFSIEVKPCLRSSLSTVQSQVVLGLTFLLLPSGLHVN